MAEITLSKIRWLLDKAYPRIGNRAISKITAQEVLLVLRSVEATGRYESARRMRSVLSRVFRYAIATDIRIAGRSAKMNVAFVKIGLSECELGTSYFLPRIVGASLATELMMTGKFIGADRALASGLVSAMVDDEMLEDTARVIVDDLLASSPMGLRKTKGTLARTSGMDDLGAVITLEERVQMACMEAGLFAPQIVRPAERR